MGHVQKRVGTWLRTLKRNVKNLGRRGKLTNYIVDRLQNHYEIAVRQNVEHPNGMEKAIHATSFHVSIRNINTGTHTVLPENLIAINKLWSCDHNRIKFNTV